MTSAATAVPRGSPPGRRPGLAAGVLVGANARRSRGDPTLCALWTALAREEEEHAPTLAAARRRPDATPDQHLTAALGLETTELEALRHVLLEASQQPASPEPATHAARLAEFARGSHDPHVQLQAALPLARARLYQGRRADTGA